MQYSKWLAIILVSLLSTASFAQSKMQMAKIKQRLMTELKISNTKADSVVGIVESFYTNARSIKSSTTLKEDDRKLALQKNRKEELARLQLQLSHEQIRKLQELIQEMKQQKHQQKSAKDSTSMHH